MLHSKRALKLDSLADRALRPSRSRRAPRADRPAPEDDRYLRTIRRRSSLGAVEV
jgi:hypothetical protein